MEQTNALPSACPWTVAKLKGKHSSQPFNLDIANVFFGTCTDLSLTRVASEAGFSSETYLIQVFRQELGITPARYRRRLRAEDGG